MASLLHIVPALALLLQLQGYKTTGGPSAAVQQALPEATSTAIERNKAEPFDIT